MLHHVVFSTDGLVQKNFGLEKYGVKKSFSFWGWNENLEVRLYIVGTVKFIMCTFLQRVFVE